MKIEKAMDVILDYSFHSKGEFEVAEMLRAILRALSHENPEARDVELHEYHRVADSCDNAEIAALGRECQRRGVALRELAARLRDRGEDVPWTVREIIRHADVGRRATTGAD